MLSAVEAEMDCPNRLSVRSVPPQSEKEALSLLAVLTVATSASNVISDVEVLEKATPASFIQRSAYSYPS
jgi:hypothetical protein